MSSEEHLRHFQRRRGRFNVVLRFLAGLTKLSCLISSIEREELISHPKSIESEHNLKPDGENTIVLVNWIFEAQNNDFNEKFIGTGIVQFTRAKSLHAMDYYSLGYCIVHSQCQWMLDLRYITKEKAEILVAGASDGPIGRSRVIGLKLDSQLGILLLEGLKGVLNLQELSLVIAKKCSNIPWTHFFSLNVLKIHSSREISEGIRQRMEEFAKAMLSNQSLEKLELSGQLPFTDAAVDYLAQFIVSSNTMQYLGIGVYLFSVYGLRLLAHIIRCSSKVRAKKRRGVRVLYIKTAIASPNMANPSDTLYPGNEPPIELVVLSSKSETRKVKFDNVKDLDEVLKAYPNMGQHIHISLPTPVNVDNLLSLAQVLHNNYMLHVKVALDVYDVRDIKELLKVYPNMGQCNVHLSVFGVVTVTGSDLLQLAQVMHNNPTLHVIGELRVKINDRRDTEGLAEVLRLTNKKQYIPYLVNVSDLPLLLHSNHIIPQVKVPVMISDGEDTKTLDEVLREYPDMCKCISLFFPEHPSLSGMNVEVMNCLPSKVDKIKENIQIIDSFFSPR